MLCAAAVPVMVTGEALAVKVPPLLIKFPPNVTMKLLAAKVAPEAMVSGTLILKIVD